MMQKSGPTLLLCRLINSARPMRRLSRQQLLRCCDSQQSRNMTSDSTNQRVSRLFDDSPAFIYGTAWKKDQTKRLVKEALAQGFRRIDTAAQPRHYQEALVGEALREAYAEGVVSRSETYVRDFSDMNKSTY